MHALRFVLRLPSRGPGGRSATPSRRLLALLPLLPVIACADPVEPSAHVVTPDPAPSVSRIVDTIRTTAGAEFRLLPADSAHRGGAVSVLFSPTAGTIDVRESGVWYRPTGSVHGLDYVVLRVAGEPSAQSRMALVRLAPAGAEWPGVRVLRQAVANDVSSRHEYVAMDPEHPRVAALRPLVADILADYGNPADGLGRARALRDWVARVAIHPHGPLHPPGSTANLAVLPAGASWARVIQVGTQAERLAADSRFWMLQWPDGIAMLDRLLGTLDTASGRRADDGQLVHVAGSHYRVRDVETYHYVLCSYQSRMLIALWAAAGLHGMMLSTIGHDASGVFIPELGKWVYMDPTFNEEYALDGVGDPLSPPELLAYSAAGLSHLLVKRSIAGPHWSRDRYADARVDPLASYVGQYPGGFTLMGSQLQNAVARPGSPDRHVQIDLPWLASDPTFGDQRLFAPVPISVAFPRLGVQVLDVAPVLTGRLVRLGSTLPYHVRFERRLDGGPWETVAAANVVPPSAIRVEYRSLDGTGNTGTPAVLEFDLCLADLERCDTAPVTPNRPR